MVGHPHAVPALVLSLSALFYEVSTGNLPAPQLLRSDPALQAAGPLLALPGARGIVSLISWSLPAGELGSQVHSLHQGPLAPTQPVIYRVLRALCKSLIKQRPQVPQPSWSSASTWAEKGAAPVL